MSDPEEPRSAFVPDPSATIPFRRAVEPDETDETDGPPQRRTKRASPPAMHASSFTLGFLAGFAIASCMSAGILATTIAFG